MAETPELPLDPQLYRDALNSLRLREVVLRELHVTCDNPVAGDVKINISPSAEGNFEKGELRIQSQFVVSARNAEVSLFTVDCSFDVVMSVPGELPDGFIEVYIAHNLFLTVFPYVRELVSSLTARMGLPPLVLPYVTNPFAPTPPKPKRRASKKKAAD